MQSHPLWDLDQLGFYHQGLALVGLPNLGAFPVQGWGKWQILLGQHKDHKDHATWAARQNTRLASLSQ
jgi:hypothetical protein